MASLDRVTDPPGVPQSSDAQDFQTAVGDLRVALVHDWLTGMRGGEKVLEAIAELFPGAPIYTLFAFEDKLSPALRRHPIHKSLLQSRLPGGLLARHYRYFLPLFPRFIEEFDLTGYDLVISTSHCVAKGVIPGPETVHLCYCHSPMRYAWDLEHHYFPKRRGLLAEIRAHLLSGLRRWDSATCDRVDHFWANSRWVATRIHRYYGRSAEVLHPPVAVDSFGGAPDAALDAEADASLRTDSDHGDTADLAKNATKAYNQEIGAPPTTGATPAPFALAVSALVPYKKLDLAIQACEAAALPLKIVGTGPEEKRLRSLCQTHAELLGRVDDDTLRQLFHDAQLFIQPGVEDFGIAAVEALASGTPVVAVGRGGVLDIVEDGRHGVLYEGFEVADVTAAIDKFQRIRFNALELKTRSRSFSSAQFAAALRLSIARHVSNRSRLAQAVPGSGRLRPTERR
ncbi:MAG: glycosyltransferase [Acidobacteriota bacterium]